MVYKCAICEIERDSPPETLPENWIRYECSPPPDGEGLQFFCSRLCFYGERRTEGNYVGQYQRHPVIPFSQRVKEVPGQRDAPADPAFPDNGTMLGARPAWPNLVKHSSGPTACRKITTLGDEIAHSVATSATFYKSMFCRHCTGYFPTSEFTWVHEGKKGQPICAIQIPAPGQV